MSVLSCSKDSEIDKHCYTASNPPGNSEKVTIEQGVWGNVWFWSGNFMPISRGEICQVERTIYIFEPARKEDVEQIGYSSFYSEVNTNLVASIDSDADGFFQVELEPGDYSVFVEENGDYYANGFGGDGQISPFEVEEGKLTELHLNITYKAVF